MHSISRMEVKKMSISKSSRHSLRLKKRNTVLLFVWIVFRNLIVSGNLSNYRVSETWYGKILNIIYTPMFTGKCLLSVWDSTNQLDNQTSTVSSSPSRPIYPSSLGTNRTHESKLYNQSCVCRPIPVTIRPMDPVLFATFHSEFESCLSQSQSHQPIQVCIGLHYWKWRRETTKLQSHGAFHQLARFRLNDSLDFHPVLNIIHPIPLFTLFRKDS